MQGFPVPSLLLALLCGTVSCAPDAVLVEPPDPRPPCEGTYSTVPKGECDVYLQDCEGSDLCVVASDGSDYLTLCSPSFGGKGIGEPCSIQTECDTSLLCSYGACAPVCCPTSHVPCGEGGLCASLQTYGDHQVYRCVYGEPCELFVPDACAELGEVCRILLGYDAALCLPASGLQEEGGSCDTTTDCTESLMCWKPVSNQPGTCRYNCLFDVPPATPPGSGGCPPGQNCAKVITGIENYGVCVS
jgi:hypothetical protein